MVRSLLLYFSLIISSGNKTYSIASIAYGSQQSIIICWLLLILLFCFIKKFRPIIIMQFRMYIARTALSIKIPFLLQSRSVFFFCQAFSLISVVVVCLLALGSYLWSRLSACICDQFLIQSIFFCVASYVWGQRCCLHNFCITFETNIVKRTGWAPKNLLDIRLLLMICSQNARISEAKINKFRTVTQHLRMLVIIINRIGYNMIF